MQGLVDGNLGKALDNGVKKNTKVGMFLREDGTHGSTKPGQVPYRRVGKLEEGGPFERVRKFGEPEP